jgi:hypothetical protein
LRASSKNKRGSGPFSPPPRISLDGESARTRARSLVVHPASLRAAAIDIVLVDIGAALPRATARTLFAAGTLVVREPLDRIAFAASRALLATASLLLLLVALAAAALLVVTLLASAGLLLATLLATLLAARILLASALLLLATLLIVTALLRRVALLAFATRIVCLVAHG